jgi:hypothetical protein
MMGLDWGLRWGLGDSKFGLVESEGWFILLYKILCKFPIRKAPKLKKLKKAQFEFQSNQLKFPCIHQKLILSTLKCQSIIIESHECNRHFIIIRHQNNNIFQFFSKS